MAHSSAPRFQLIRTCHVEAVPGVAAKVGCDACENGLLDSGGKGPGGGAAGMYKMKSAPMPTLKKGQENSKSPVPEGTDVHEAVFVKIPAKYKAKGTSGLSMELKAGKQSKDFELND